MRETSSDERGRGRCGRGTRGRTTFPGWTRPGGIWLKVLRVDPSSGVWVVRNRFEPGTRLQTHRHSGPVDGYTISGRWHYLEYDFYQHDRLLHP